jgi:hypothetical protein
VTLQALKQIILGKNIDGVAFLPSHTFQEKKKKGQFIVMIGITFVKPKFKKGQNKDQNGT